MIPILAVERFVAPYRYDQDTVTGWVRRWLEEAPEPAVARLLSVYASAGVHTRGSVVPIENVFAPGDFETQNDTYAREMRRIAVDLAGRTLAAADLPPRAVDFIVSVSCTGFMI